MVKRMTLPEKCKMTGDGATVGVGINPIATSNVVHVPYPPTLAKQPLLKYDSKTGINWLSCTGK
jgi:hypothetical protein